MDVRYLILGAGVSGLACASKLPRESSYLLLEKEQEVGGYCRTFYQNGYVWDYAGHFFHFRNDSIRNEFLDLLTDSDMVLNRKNTKIFYKDRYIDYPFQNNIHQLEKGEFIECLVDLFSRDNSNPSNFKQMLYNKFGKSITEKFLEPYNTKLYACSLDSLDKDAMGRFFPYAEPEEIIRGFRKGIKKTYNEQFYYSRKGARAFVDRLMSKVLREKILLEERVLKIDLNNKEVITNREKYRYEYLVSTIPFTDFIKFSNIKMNSELSSNKVLVFNMGFDNKSVDTDVHWIYYPDPEICFYRVGFYNNILHKDNMSIYVEIGFSKDEDIQIAYWFDKVLFDLRKVGVITDHQLLEHNFIVMDPAYVHICSETVKEKEEIKFNLQKQGVHLVGRYGDWTYCSIEDCIAQGYEVAALLREGESDVIGNTLTN